jgi:hypothetical protein
MCARGVLTSGFPDLLLDLLPFFTFLKIVCSWKSVVSLSILIASTTDVTAKNVSRIEKMPRSFSHAIGHQISRVSKTTACWIKARRSLLDSNVAEALEARPCGIEALPIKRRELRFLADLADQFKRFLVAPGMIGARILITVKNDHEDRF